METTEKKLTANEVIVQMVSCANAGKLDILYDYATKYRDTLAKTGDWHYRLNRLIKERPKIAELKSLPSSVNKLLIQKDIEECVVYLPENISEFVSEFMLEWQNKDVYNNHNLPLQNKVLFHGSTGNGKTTIARHIAKLMGLPFVEINSDMIIDSHIGSTSSNIHNIFKEIKEPCILFWDEVDSIGRKRGGDSSTAAGNENDRMVNSMLVNIEKLGQDVIFFGATNRMDILDSAFLRRFDTIVEIEAPTIEQKVVFFDTLKAYYNIVPSINNIENIASYSDIKRHFIKEARKMVRDKVLAKTSLF